MEKFRGFRGLIGDRETFPANFFVLVLNWNIMVDRTLQEENKTVNAQMRYTDGYFELLCH